MLQSGSRSNTHRNLRVHLQVTYSKPRDKESEREREKVVVWKPQGRGDEAGMRGFIE